MDATNNIATDLFYKIRSRFTGLKLGDETGTITINPEEARFFDFDYMQGEAAIGHVSISLAESNSIKVYFSTGITESMDVGQKNSWYGFLKELRLFAKRRLMSFDTRDITKDNLDQRDYAFLTQHNQPKQQQNNIVRQVGESKMNVSESAMYGSKNVSYQKLMDTRLIIKHNQAVMDDTQPGARTRNISALFVENQDGERFKYPFIHLAGARAMQRHVANGGLPYDDVGKSIIGMSEEIAQLKSFGNYVVRNDLMNSMTNGIVEKSSSYLNSLREQIKAIAKQGHYEAYRENFQTQTPLEVPQDVVEQFTDQFTVKNFKEDIATVFPVLYRLMKESEIGYDDIVEMTGQEVEEETEHVANDPFAKFERWAMELGEASAITSEDEEERSAALKSLQELVSQHFPAGVDGTNAIESLKGIIEDPQLFSDIKQQATEDPDGCVRGLVKDWLEQNAPETLEQLDFGDFVEEPTGEAPATDQGGDITAPEAPREEADGPNKSDVPAYLRKQKGGDDWKVSTKDMDDERTKSPTSSAGLARRKKELGMESQQLNVQELAEFIHSFYDRDSGTFPKGPEGVCTMVGKKFGEQAEMVARKMVERMAPQQQAPELQELSRIRELAGNTRPVKENDQEGPADLLAAVEQEINNPGRSIDNLTDVMNATFGSDRSPEFKKARAVIGKYLDLIDNAEVGSEEDGIAPMRGGNIVRHIREYDLTDRLAHAAAMLDKVIGGRRPVESASMPGDQYLSIPADQTKLSLGQQMARDGITHNGNEQEMIGQIAKYMKDRGDSSRTIRYYMNDNDFVADTLSDLKDAGSQRPNYKSKMQDKFGGDAAELTKGLKIRDDVNPELEESSSYYYEKLAQEVFDMNPNLDTSGRADDLLNAAFPLMVRDLGSKKRANNLLNYDEDFPSDFVSAYGELKRNSGSNESSTMELEAIKRLSGISQGMGF